MSKFAHHLRSNVIGYLALFVALGGTAYAAIELPKNSVSSKQIKNNSVKSKDVKDGNLVAGDFKDGQLPTGAPGEQGVPGAPGEQGVPGAPGSALAFAHVNADGTLDQASSKNVLMVTRKPSTFVNTYCLDVTTAQSPLNAVATVDVAGADSTTDIVALTLVPGQVAGACTAGADAVAFTGRTTAVGGHTSLPFYIVFN